MKELYNDLKDNKIVIDNYFGIVVKIRVNQDSSCKPFMIWSFQIEYELI